MRIRSSSSIIFATLAVSSSSSNLAVAAPAESSAGAMSPSTSNQNIATESSSVPAISSSFPPTSVSKVADGIQRRCFLQDDTSVACKVAKTLENKLGFPAALIHFPDTSQPSQDPEDMIASKPNPHALLGLRRRSLAVNPMSSSSSSITPNSDMNSLNPPIAPMATPANTPSNTPYLGMVTSSASGVDPTASSTPIGMMPHTGARRDTAPMNASAHHGAPSSLDKSAVTPPVSDVFPPSSEAPAPSTSTISNSDVAARELVPGEGSPSDLNSHTGDPSPPNAPSVAPPAAVSPPSGARRGLALPEFDVLPGNPGLNILSGGPPVLPPYGMIAHSGVPVLNAAPRISAYDAPSDLRLCFPSRVYHPVLLFRG